MAAHRAIDQARMFISQGNSQAAVSLLSKLIQSEPDNLDAWLALADAVEEPERVTYCLQKVLDLDPSNAEALERISKQRGARVSVGTFGSSQAAAPGATPGARPVKTRTTKPAESGNGGQTPGPQVAGPTPDKATPQADGSRSPRSLQSDVARTTQELLAAGTRRFGRTDLILIGLTVFVGFVLCALVGAAAVGGLSRQPAESPDEIVQVVFNNIIAANREDMAAYMGTIHPDAPGYDTTQATIAGAFSLYDLSYEIFIPEMIEHGTNEAIISYELTTRRKNGPAFQDNVVTGQMRLKKFEGEWRIYDQTVEDVQFLN